MLVVCLGCSSVENECIDVCSVVHWSSFGMDAEADTSHSQMRNRTCDVQKLTVVQSCCGSPDFCWEFIVLFLTAKQGTCFSPETS